MEGQTQSSTSHRKGLIGILVVVVLFFIIFMYFAFTVLKGLQGKIDLSGGDSGDKAQIAVIEVEGVIMDSKQIVEKLHIAEKDEDIKAIIMRINSPGGAVGPTQEVYEEIRRIDKEIPIYSSFGAIAASGGYYIASATREIYSNAGTLTGSIGVIMNFMDLSKLYEFAKVKPEIVKAGKLKDAGGAHREMSKEERKYFTKMLSVVHEQFKKDILRTREKKLKGNINDLAQGQIYSGEEAFNVGLVDSLKSLYGAAREIHKKLKLESEFKIRYIEKKKRSKIYDLLNDIEGSVKGLKSHFTGTVPLFMMETK